jgi:hypothetical protein
MLAGVVVPAMAMDGGTLRQDMTPKIPGTSIRQISLKLPSMATVAKSYSNVVALSLRNELRAVGNQTKNSHAD